MIKFFRKIRFDLMEKNKTGKYLKYAIGEIVLVVVGILIALQINTWNENRIQTKLVNGILIEIYNNLQSDQKELKNDVEFAKKFIDKLVFIENNLTKIEKDSLPKIIGEINLITSWTSNSSGFEKFSNVATENIISTDLRNLISENYNYFLSKDRNSTSTLSISSAMLLKEYLIKYGLPINANGIVQDVVDVDVYNLIVNDKEFYGIIRNQQYNWNVQIYGYNQHLKAIEEMKLGLENYFQSKKIEYNLLTKL